MRLKKKLGFILFAAFFLLIIYLAFLINERVRLREIKDVLMAQGEPYHHTVEDFALLDHDGKFHRLHYYTYPEAIVLMTHRLDCETNLPEIDALKSLYRRYRKRGVLFFMLNANPGDERTSIAEHARLKEIPFPILKDETRLIAESLGAKQTAETFLINPKNWQILYRGPLRRKDQNNPDYAYLENALRVYLAGEEFNFRISLGEGCALQEQPAIKKNPGEITYVKDIVPILKNRCMNCHIPKGMGPWAMTSYETVKKWGPMIREVVRTQRMPPWHADPFYGEFSNDRSLNVEEARMLVQWIETGMPRGEGEDPLPEFSSRERPEWQFGEPDVILETPAQVIPAAGILPYRHLVLDFDREKDLWLRAVQIRPSNAKTLHHAALFPGPLEDKEWETMSRELWEGREWMAGYAPGIATTHVPDQGAFLLKKDMKLLLELHYVATGKLEIDKPKIALYFHDSENPKPFRTIIFFGKNFEIPPRVQEYKITKDFRMKKAADLYGLLPHMHFRGKRMKITALYPDGESEVLLSVPGYDFYWQTFYYLKKKKPLPAGTVLRCEGAFDNSPYNPKNPNPNKRVKEGNKSTNEMFLCGFLVHQEMPEDETAAALRTADHEN